MITNDDSDICSRMLLYPRVTPNKVREAGTPETLGIENTI